MCCLLFCFSSAAAAAAATAAVSRHSFPSVCLCFWFHCCVAVSAAGGGGDGGSAGAGAMVLYARFVSPAYWSGFIRLIVHVFAFVMLPCQPHTARIQCAIVSVCLHQI